MKTNNKNSFSITALKYFYIFLFVLLLPGLAFSANHYIRSGATGSNDGSDWTNAWTELPATLTRGDTYYIADGTYGYYDFDDAESGTDYIYIRKATTDNPDCTSVTGWSSTYGDDQAHFNADQPDVNGATLRFQTGYWVFDGATGSGSNESSYGFKISPSTYSAPRRLIGIPASNQSSLQIDHVQISHTAMILPGSSYDYSQIGLYSNPIINGVHDITVSHNYFANGQSNILFRKWKNCTIKNNYFANNWSSPSNHGQQISPGNDCDDIVLCNNIFKDSFTFVVGCHKYDSERWKIYNNIIIGGTNMKAVFANGESSWPDVIKGWEVHHNTLINVNLSSGFLFTGTLSDPTNDRSFAYNNLFYNCTNPRMTNPGFTPNTIIYSNNAYFDCAGTFDNDEGGTADVSSGNPFVSQSDYHLVHPTLAGKNDLLSTFDIDFAGLQRGKDGIVDRGAYEFHSTNSQPFPPTGLKVITQ